MEIITRPLLAVIREVSCVEAELCTIIRNKDKQIADYKTSGAAVSRREYLLQFLLFYVLQIISLIKFLGNLETADFDQEKFLTERRLKTVDSSLKEDVVTMLCQTSTSNCVYSNVAERMKHKPK